MLGHMLHHVRVCRLPGAGAGAGPPKPKASTSIERESDFYASESDFYSSESDFYASESDFYATTSTHTLGVSSRWQLSMVMLSVRACACFI